MLGNFEIIPSNEKEIAPDTYHVMFNDPFAICNPLMTVTDDAFSCKLWHSG